MAEGKVHIEVQYCVPTGFYWQASTVAGQIVAGREREVGITLTPVKDGRFQVYLDGDLVYDRNDIPQGVLKDPTGDAKNSVAVAEMIRTKVLTKLDKIDGKVPAAVGSAH